MTGALGTDAATWAGIAFLSLLSGAIFLAWFFCFSGRSTGLVYALVAAQAAFIGQVLGCMLVLGWLGILRPIPLAAVNALVTAGICLLGVRPRWQAVREQNRTHLSRLRKVRIPVWVALLGALMLVVIARNVFWGWFLPPYMRDDVAYHLSIMGNILQSGAIRFFPSPAERISYFPINSELFQGWQVIFLGSDKLADLAFLPTILAGGLALYGLCRRFGFSRRASVAGWAVFAFTPLVFLQQVGSYNDAWMAAVFLCGVYLALAPVPPGDAAGTGRTAVLAGICAGVILGTKFSGVLSSLAVLALMVHGLIRLPRFAEDGGRITPIRRRAGPLLMSAAVFGLCAAAYGGWPLLRNAVYAGNPLAPVEVKIGSQVIWPGKAEDAFLAIGSEDLIRDTENSWDLAYQIWFERSRMIFDWNNGGTGPIWLFLGLPGAALWLWAALRRRDGAALLVGILCLGILIFTPAQWRPRYVLPLMLLCGLGGALLYESLGAWPRRILSGMLALAAAFVVAAALRPAPLEPDKAATLVFLSDDAARSAAGAHPNNELYGWVDARTSGAPAVIAYGRWVDAYPLFGSDLRNTVLSFLADDAEEWDRLLRENDVDLAVVASGSSEEEWMKSAGEYREVFRYETWIVYARQ